MGRTCDHCGRTFETLSSYRLHDCPDRGSDADDEPYRAEQYSDMIDRVDRTRRKRRQAETRRARRAASTDLTDALERAEAGDSDAAFRLLGRYERELADVENAENWDRYWRLQEGLYEPIVAALEAIVVTEGWPYLVELLEAYWPDVAADLDAHSVLPAFEDESVDSDDYAHVSHVLAGTTGRYTIRTRRAEGVAAIPTMALEFLFLHHRYPDEGAWVESMTYGWGIGHPNRPFADNVHALVDGGHDIWAGAILEHAFHADQYAATALLEDVFDAGIVADPAMMLRGLGSIDRGRYPDEPRYWDWEAVYPEFAKNGFEWDPDVEARLRELVEEVGFDRYLPEEWSFADIEI